METMKELIRPELLVLIPVLYFTGIGLKKSASVLDKHIPLLLGGLGIFLAVIYMLGAEPADDFRQILQLAFAGITQGVLCAGCSVYVNQVVKQAGKKGEGE